MDTAGWGIPPFGCSPPALLNRVVNTLLSHGGNVLVAFSGKGEAQDRLLLSSLGWAQLPSHIRLFRDNGKGLLPPFGGLVRVVWVNLGPNLDSRVPCHLLACEGEGTTRMTQTQNLSTADIEKDCGAWYVLKKGGEEYFFLKFGHRVYFCDSNGLA